jgi:CRP-like cAMP-binding protein
MNLDRIYTNRLLGGLPEADRALLQASLSPVTLPTRKTLEVGNRAIDFVYFLDSGLASVIARAGSDRAIEIALIGHEGMTGVAVVLGADRTPHETFIQSAGAGWRIAAPDLRDAMRNSQSLRARLLLYAQALAVQTGYTALANARHSIEERLARWLLMAHDRAPGDRVNLTHELLAIMLGIRRPGVTTAINLLESDGFVGLERGEITILDRGGLEGAANGSYGGAEAEYERLFPRK